MEEKLRLKVQSTNLLSADIPKMLMISSSNPFESCGETKRPIGILKALPQNHYKVDHLSTKGFSGLGVQFSTVFSKLLKKKHYNIVYAHQENALYAALFKFRTLSRYKLIFDCHGNPFGETKANPYLSVWRKNLQSLTYGFIPIKLSDRIITPSLELFDLYKHTNKFFFVPNGVNTCDFYPEEKNDNPFKKGPIVVFTCPRNFYANLIALHILLKVAKIQQHVTFLILGGGPVVAAPKNVVFSGYIADLRKYINAADLCIMPYANIGITCGGSRNKLLEYWACGKPVISTLEGIRGIPEAKKNENFYLVSDDPRSISEGINYLVQNDDVRTKIANNGFSLVQKKYTWKKQAEKVDVVIRSLLDS